MEAVAEKLDAKLRTWGSQTRERVSALIDEIIARADEDALDLARSRTAEQEVLDLLDDEPASR